LWLALSTCGAAVLAFYRSIRKFMLAMYAHEHDADAQPRLTLSLDERAWDDADKPEGLGEAEGATASSRAKPAPEADTLVARYFGEVRQHALLGVAAEQALWAQIEYGKARSRRALYTSPVALATLQQVWQQVEIGRLPLRQLIRDTEKASQQAEAIQTQFRAAIGTLQTLEPLLYQPQPRQAVCVSPAERQQQRQARATGWRQWLAVWEELGLHPSVHETLHHALEEARRLTPESQALQRIQRLWSRSQRLLAQAKERMLRANLRLVIHIANRYHHDDVPFLDLVQEGNLGLMRALEKFEPQRGVKFITYAYWWIQQAISRAIIEQHRTVRVPEHIVARQDKLRATAGKLAKLHGRSPSKQELSAALGWATTEIDELHLMAQPIIRLQQPRLDDDRPLLDLMEDSQSPAPEQYAETAQFHHRLALCLSRLPAREALILRLRYGLEGEEPQTLQEIGDRLGLSRERIRQLEKQAMTTLRQPRQQALLSDFAEHEYKEQPV
jgi:RNA polymerase sigma factor (sigma-70 family)